MRPIWWFALGAGLALTGLVVALVFVFGGGNGSVKDGTTTKDGTVGECRPAPRSEPAGNADLTERVSGRGFDRTIVIRAKDKESREPLRGAKVVVRAEMSCPHFMPLYEQRLREISGGTYRGTYRLIMPGHWKFVVVFTSKRGGSTTASFPLEITG